jgi:hypothetical protein
MSEFVRIGDEELDHYAAVVPMADAKRPVVDRMLKERKQERILTGLYEKNRRTGVSMEERPLFVRSFLEGQGVPTAGMKDEEVAGFLMPGASMDEVFERTSKSLEGLKGGVDPWFALDEEQKKKQSAESIQQKKLNARGGAKIIPGSQGTPFEPMAPATDEQIQAEKVQKTEEAFSNSPKMVRDAYWTQMNEQARRAATLSIFYKDPQAAMDRIEPMIEDLPGDQMRMFAAVATAGRPELAKAFDERLGMSFSKVMQRRKENAKYFVRSAGAADASSALGAFNRLNEAFGDESAVQAYFENPTEEGRKKFDAVLLEAQRNNIQKLSVSLPGGQSAGLKMEGAGFTESDLIGFYRAGKQMSDWEKQYNTVSKVVQENYAPLDDKFPLTLGLLTFEDFVSGAEMGVDMVSLAAVTFAGNAVVPGAGTGIAVGATWMDHQAEMERKLVYDHGMKPVDAKLWTGVMAVPYAAAEYIQVKGLEAFTAKGLPQYLGSDRGVKMMGYYLGAWFKRSSAGTVKETGEEVVQAGIDFALKETARNFYETEGLTFDSNVQDFVDESVDAVKYMWMVGLSGAPAVGTLQGIQGSIEAGKGNRLGGFIKGATAPEFRQAARDRVMPLNEFEAEVAYRRASVDLAKMEEEAGFKGGVPQAVLDLVRSKQNEETADLADVLAPDLNKLGYRNPSAVVEVAQQELAVQSLAAERVAQRIQTVNAKLDSEMGQDDFVVPVHGPKFGLVEMALNGWAAGLDVDLDVVETPEAFKAKYGFAPDGAKAALVQGKTVVLIESRLKDHKDAYAQFRHEVLGHVGFDLTRNGPEITGKVLGLIGKETILARIPQYAQMYKAGRLTDAGLVEEFLAVLAADLRKAAVTDADKTFLEKAKGWLVQSLGAESVSVMSAREVLEITRQIMNSAFNAGALKKHSNQGTARARATEEAEQGSKEWKQRVVVQKQIQQMENDDPFISLLLQNGGILMPKLKPGQSHTDEMAAVPKRFRGTNGRGLAIDEMATYLAGELRNGDPDFGADELTAYLQDFEAKIEKLKSGNAGSSDRFYDHEAELVRRLEAGEISQSEFDAGMNALVPRFSVGKFPEYNGPTDVRAMGGDPAWEAAVTEWVKSAPDVLRFDSAEDPQNVKIVHKNTRDPAMPWRFTSFFVEESGELVPRGHEEFATKAEAVMNASEFGERKLETGNLKPEMGKVGAGDVRFSVAPPVDSSEFKTWFGDWESAWVLKWLDEAKPVASMKGDEVPHFAKLKDLSNWISADWSERFGTSIEHDKLGPVVVDKHSASSSIGHGLGSIKAQAFYLVPDALKASRVLGELPRVANKPRAFLLVAPVLIGKDSYRMIMEVRRDANIQRLYLHEVVLRENKKDSAGAFNSSAASLKGAEPQGAHHGAIYSYISELRKKQVSAVVDENGKPLVVYHGTGSNFNVFDRTKTKRGNLVDGFYFSPSADEAGIFARKTTFDKSGGNIIPVYVSLKNPSIVRGADTGAERAGHDGIIQIGADGKIKTVVAFESNQIKSVYNAGTWDGTNPDIRFSVAGLGFYSPLERVVSAFKQDTFTAYQLRGMVKNAPGVKQEELDDLGFYDWLDGIKGKVTKAQALEFIENGGPKIQEVTHYKLAPIAGWFFDDGEKKEFFTFREEAELAAKTQGVRVTEDTVYEGRTISDVDGGAKFGTYQLPGGENYREVLLTLPEQEDPSKGYFISKAGEKFRVISKTGSSIGGLFESMASAQLFLKDKLRVTDLKQRNYKSSHWDEANVLAHVRLNDRIGPNGEKILFIEEIQSDWHQAGRKKGYKVKRPDTSKWSAVRVNIGWNVSDENGPLANTPRFWNTEQEAIADVADTLADEGVPDAPFKKSWAMLAFKRVLRMAAEQGYDSVAWTPGEVQAERYDLSKQVDSISFTSWPAAGEGMGILSAYKNDQQVIKETIAEKELDGYIGKDAAIKLIESPKNPITGQRFIEGSDLKVGGDGMKGFYDQILPKEVQKYVGKLGGKVGTILIDPNQGEALAWDEMKVWNLPIPDSMRESVMQGQPRFSIEQHSDAARSAAITLAGQLLEFKKVDKRKVGDLLAKVGVSGSRVDEVLKDAKEIAGMVSAQKSFGGDLAKLIGQAEIKQHYSKQMMAAHEMGARGGAIRQRAEDEVARLMAERKKYARQLAVGFTSGELDDKNRINIADLWKKLIIEEKVRKPRLAGETEKAYAERMKVESVPVERLDLEKDSYALQVADWLHEVRSSVLRSMIAKGAPLPAGAANAFKDPLVVAEYMKTVENLLRQKLPDLNFGLARARVESRLARLESIKVLAKYDKEVGEILGEMFNAAIDQNRQEWIDYAWTLLDKVKGQIKTRQSKYSREISARSELMFKEIRTVLSMNEEEIDSEIDGILSKLDGVDNLDAQQELRDRLMVLNRFGGLNYKRLGEIADAVEWLRDTMFTELETQQKLVEERKAKAAEWKSTILAALPNKSVEGSGIKASARKMLTRGLPLKMRLNDLVRYGVPAAADAARKLVDEYSERISSANFRRMIEEDKTRAWFKSVLEKAYGTAAGPAWNELTRLRPELAKYSDDGLDMSKSQLMQLVATFSQADYRERAEMVLRFEGDVRTLAGEMRVDLDKLKGRRASEIAELELSAAFAEQAGLDVMTSAQMISALVEEGSRLGRQYMAAAAAVNDKALDDADFQVIKAFKAWYAASRGPLSDVLKDITGLPIPGDIDPNYVPVKKQYLAGGLNSASARAPVVPKGLTRRVSNFRSFDESADLIGLWLERMGDNAQFKHFGALHADLGVLFNDSDVMHKTKVVHGAAFASGLITHLQDVMSGKPDNGKYKEPAVDLIINAKTYAALGFNYRLLLQQMTSYPAFGFFVDFKEIAGYIADLKTEEGWNTFKMILQSDWSKARRASGNTQVLNETLAKMDKYSVARRYKELAMWPTMYGDALTVAMFGSGYYRAMKVEAARRGMAPDKIHEWAMDRLWEVSELSQQSGAMMNRAEWQRAGSWGRGFAMFMGPTPQYLAIQTDALREFTAAKDSGDPERRAAALKKFQRVVLINHVILPLGLNAFKILAGALMGAGFDEDDVKNILVSMLVGPYAGVYLMGTILTGAADAAFGGDGYGKDITPLNSLMRDVNYSGQAAYALATLNFEELPGLLHKLMKNNFAPYRDVSNTVKNYSD